MTLVIRRFSVATLFIALNCAGGVLRAQTPAVNLPLLITDGVVAKTLFFGLDPAATDGFDPLLGESELPPRPPIGIFDARLIGTDIGIPLGEGSLKDYRQGGTSTRGNRVHELYYQVGSGATITIRWNIPPAVSGRLQDIITGALIDVPMHDSGSYQVTNPSAFSKLKMTITYAFTNAVEVGETYPESFVLSRIYPNPFNPETNIEIRVPTRSFVTITIHDVRGARISTLVNQWLDPGAHTFVWDARSYASGVYYCTLKANDINGGNGFGKTRSALLIR